MVFDPSGISFRRRFLPSGRHIRRKFVTGDTCTGKSAVHGTGLFAARGLPARHALGTFTGVRLTDAQFAQRKAAGGRCLLRFTDLDGQEVLLDGEGRSNRAFVNSVAGTGCEANVEFVCNGECLQVYTLRAVAEGEELLAEYEVAGRGAARRRQMAQAPPPLPPVRAVDAEEFLGRLRHAALGAGGYAAHEAVRADASAALADFTASFGRAGSLAEAVQRLRVKQPALGDVKLADLGGAALSASAPQPMLDALQRAGLGQEAPVLVLYIALLFLCACYTYPMAPAAPTAATRRGVSLAERASSLRQPQNAPNTRRPGAESDGGTPRPAKLRALEATGVQR
jgi:hypothetical protein